MLQPDMLFQDSFEMIMVHIGKVIPKSRDVIFVKNAFHCGIETNWRVIRGICTMKVEFAHESVRGSIADFGVKKQYMQIHPGLEWFNPSNQAHDSFGALTIKVIQ